MKSNMPKFEARNWKQLTDKQLSKLTPIERSRYMAYEPPAKDVEERRKESLKRVREAKVLEREYDDQDTIHLHLYYMHCYFQYHTHTGNMLDCSLQR